MVEKSPASLEQDENISSPTYKKKLFNIPYYDVLIPLLVVLSSMLLKITSTIYVDSDHFWSLAVGKWIVDHGTVPTVETFSWTVEGLPWISNSWLFCWLLYKIDEIWAVYGVATMIFLVYLITAYFLYFICRRMNPSNVSVWIFSVGIWSLIYFSVAPRAYIFTFAFLVIIMYLIRFKRDSWMIYLIPLVFLLWVNIQLSLRFGLALLFVEALVGTVFFKDRRLWLILLLSIVAALINPYGLAIWSFSLSELITPGTKDILEWQSPNFDNMSIFLRYLIMGFTGVLASYGVVFSYWKNRSIDWNRLMIFFWFWAMFIYALTMIRASHFLIILWTIYFATFTPEWVKRNIRLKPAILTAILVVFTSFMFYILPRAPLFVPILATVPGGGVEFLIENPDKQDNLFNDYIFGGFLLANDIKVFIDARADIYIREGVMDDHLALQRLSVNPDTIIEKYDIKNFIVATGRPLSRYLNIDPKWEAVYADRVSVIFSKAEDKQIILNEQSYQLEN